MDTSYIGIIAVIAYLLAGVLCALDLVLNRESKAKSMASRLIGLIGFGLHLVVLWQLVVLNWVNLGFYHALSFVSVFIVGGVFIAGIFSPVKSILVFVYPLAALVLGLELANPEVIKHQASLALDTHILLSILAYGFLAVGALFGILLFTQEYLLRNNHLGRYLKIFPPLIQTESVMFGVIGLGFVLLSASLMSGFVFLEDIFSQHLAHKTFFSIVAWLVFLVLLFGRYRYGWRGKRAVRLVLSGFVLVVLAYFGSKFVLEMLLR